MSLDPVYLARYEAFLSHTQSEELLSELKAIADDESAIEDRFYKELSFGTGGLRGVLGAGTNRLNIETVAKATQGYANHLLATCDAPSVAIAYDSRIHSRDFAEAAACVFAANGIRVWLYPILMPTPALSFAVRHLKCSGGVVITASHNPAKYNGYKVYGADGCQITTETAAAIQAAIDAVPLFTGAKTMPQSEARERKLLRDIPYSVREKYLAAVSTVSVLPSAVRRDISIVYTPLNGAGISCVPECLASHGFSNIHIPEAQSEPDGNFPTCPYPNPEIREALEVALEEARRVGSELVLATDPDCDRCGAAVRDGDDYRLLNGNEMGVLLLDFVCKMRAARGDLPENGIAIKTIVTTPMAEKISAHYGLGLINVLTGFKFIGEQIGLLEQRGEEGRYVFGFEESYGYLSGSFVRDKDAVNASLLICELFAWYKSQGRSLVDVLAELNDRYGHYQSRLLTFTYEGKSGAETMASIMAELHDNPPASAGGYAVSAVGDYLKQVFTYDDGRRENITLPKSDVVRFLLSGGRELVFRPSGTEPKLKVYLTACGASDAESRAELDALEAWCGEYLHHA